LVSDSWDVKNPKGKIERVRPGDIKTTALLSIEGELDDISGSGQTQAVHEICTGVPKSQQRHYEAKGAGHYGIFSGRRWREMVYPFVKKFILDHNVQVEAQPKGKAALQSKPVTTLAGATAPVTVTKATPVAKAKKPAAKKVAAKAIAQTAPKSAFKTVMAPIKKPADAQ
jgi:poly(3-hydroxybutyrate) depolymerase